MTARVRTLLYALPRGRKLDESEWSARHRVLLFLLAAHVPFLGGVALAGGVPWGHLARELAPVPALLGVGLVTRSRGLRSGAVTAGLVYAAAVLVHLSGGLAEAHFHYFVVLGFVALYQDWRPYLLAVGWVVVGHTTLGVLAPGVVLAPGYAQQNPWRWALVHGGSILAACVAHLVFWAFHERQQERARRYHRQLYEGESAMSERQRQTQALKDELFSVVGHEFRTPLTAILGHARTLDARLEHMDPEGAHRSAAAIEREAKRLSRVIANLLIAAESSDPEPRAATDLAELAVDVVHDVLELAPEVGRNVTVHLPQGQRVAMGRDAVYQVLFHLLDNAVKFADPASDIAVSSRRDEGSVVVEVANSGPCIDENDRERVFEAFVQGDSSDSRRHGGMGMGLHIVRKIVLAHGGRVEASTEGRRVVVRGWLPEAADGSPPGPVVLTRAV